MSLKSGGNKTTKVESAPQFLDQLPLLLRPKFRCWVCCPTPVYGAEFQSLVSSPQNMHAIGHLPATFLLHAFAGILP